LESLSPNFIGWRGIEMDNQGNPQDWKSGSRRFEVATSAYPQYEGLRAAIAVHNLWGDAQARYQQICQLSTYLWEQLQTLPRVHCLAHQPPASGLVSFTVEHPLNAAQIVQALEKQGFLLRTLLNPLCIRACVHYLTLEAEIEHLVAAITKICQS
jgi:L-cysteine/cystine lyase